jgi:hypothetical protein
MFDETSFLIIPFDRDALGRLQPGSPIRFGAEGEARFNARKVARSHAAVAVLEERSDALGEPRLIAVSGWLPAETLAIFSASENCQGGVNDVFRPSSGESGASARGPRRAGVRKTRAVHSIAIRGRHRAAEL